MICPCFSTESPTELDYSNSWHYRIIICTLETKQSHSCEGKWLIYPLPASSATPTRWFQGALVVFYGGRRDEIDLLRHRQTVVLAKAVICILPFFMPTQQSDFIKTTHITVQMKNKTLDGLLLRHLVIPALLYQFNLTGGLQGVR